MSEKNILFVIAYRGFRDEEYKEPKIILENEGCKITTASLEIGTAQGKLGMETQVDILYNKADPSDYDAIVFIGGPGSPIYWNDPDAHNLLVDAAQQNKVVAGICSACVTLAKSEVLKGKNATVFPGDTKELQPLVGKYTAADCEVDGRFITANGPGAAQKFAKAILDALNN